MTDDLVAFLREQLDADERIARAATPGPWEQDPERAGSLTSAEYWYVVDCSGTPAAGENAEHVARHDPARVLAEITAKRAIVDEHAPDRHGDCQVCADEEEFDEDSEGNGSWSRSAKRAPCRTLRLLAVPYAGVDGYRPEWAPDA
jgi:NADPH-dependent ferric siderophore reductase